MIEDLKGKVVLVTGGSTGIGAEVAKEFAANGAKVMVHYNASEADAKAVVDAITAKGGVVVALAEKFKLPVHYIGVGEGADDLRPFTSQSFARSLMGLSPEL